jgi:hypothetical protein
VVLSEPLQYRIWLTAQDVNLEEFARHHGFGKDAEMKGLAQAKLVLETEPDPKTGQMMLRGDGSIDVPTGRLYKLPVLLELVKVAKLHAPDQTGFEEAHASFRIRNDKVIVDHLDLLGTAVSLGGSGEISTNGRDAKFEFYTIWSQTLKRWLTTPFGDPTAALSETLFRIEVTRAPNGEFKFNPRMVPGITDPFRAVAERVRRRMGMVPGPPDTNTIRAAGQ